MPWGTIEDLPSAIQARYSPKQLQAFLSAFNNAFSSQGESAAFAIAHDAAQHAKGFKLFDNGRWIAWYTNPYLDRDGEYFAEKAIEGDIAYMQETGKYPELWFYHEPIRLGQADFAAKLGRFAIAFGTVDDNPVAHAIVDFAVREGYKLSHGFTYNPIGYEDHTYYSYHTYEISLVPANEAANELTGFDLEDKRMNPKVKAALEKALQGHNITVEELEEKAKAMSSRADAEVGWKIFNAMKALAEEVMAVEEGKADESPSIEVETPELTLSDLLAMIKDMGAKIESKMEEIKGYATQLGGEQATLKEDMAKMRKGIESKVQSVQDAAINSTMDDLFGGKLGNPESGAYNLFIQGLMGGGK